MRRIVLIARRDTAAAFTQDIAREDGPRKRPSKVSLSPSVSILSKLCENAAPSDATLSYIVSFDWKVIFNLSRFQGLRDSEED